MVRRMLLAAVAAGLVAGTGCRHRCCRPASSVQPNPYLPPAPPQGGWLGGPSAPGGNNIPPASVPTTPAPSGGPGFLPPAGGSSTVPPIFGPSPTAPQDSNTTPRPSNGRSPELLLPDPNPPAASPSKSGYPNRGLLGDPVDPRKGQTAEPPLSKPNPPEPDPLLKGAAPPAARGLAGVTGFAVIKDGLASGRKPDLDGLDAVKQAGYRTLVYLHAPDADVSALRAVAEKRGLVVEPIEVTPDTLADAWRKFNSTVRDAGSQPVFVCDDDGLRAGAMWYIFFRDAELMNADVARVRARGLGLTDTTEEGKTFWIAIQRYFSPR